MYTRIIWEKGVPCELPELFNPFLIQIFGSNDYQTIGSLKEPSSYKDETSKSIIIRLAHEFLCFLLLEQNQDISESTIRHYIASGNWFIKQLARYKLDNNSIQDYKILTHIFQKNAVKTRNDSLNRSSGEAQGNNTIIRHLNLVNRFLSYLFQDDTEIISDHLHHSKLIETVIEPPSELCVIETVRYMAKLVEYEATQLNKDMSSFRKNSHLTRNDIDRFFRSTQDYRNSFLYLLIAITGMNGTSAALISLSDLDISNDKKTSGKSISVYKPRANRVISFELPKDFLTRYTKPFVNLFNQYNNLCEKFNIDLKFDHLGRQIFREDERFRHISQYYLFSNWTMRIRPLIFDHLNQRLKQGNYPLPL